MATCHFKLGVAAHSQALPLILGEGCSAIHHQVWPESVCADVLQGAISPPGLSSLCAQPAVEVVQTGLVDEGHLRFIGKACNQWSRFRQRFTISILVIGASCVCVHQCMFTYTGRGAGSRGSVVLAALEPVPLHRATAASLLLHQSATLAHRLTEPV